MISSAVVHFSQSFYPHMKHIGILRVVNFSFKGISAKQPAPRSTPMLVSEDSDLIAVYTMSSAKVSVSRPALIPNFLST